MSDVDEPLIKAGPGSCEHRPARLPTPKGQRRGAVFTPECKRDIEAALKKHGHARRFVHDVVNLVAKLIGVEVSEREQLLQLLAALRDEPL